MEGGQRLDGLPEIPVTRPPPHVALVATSGISRLASCGASWRRSHRCRNGASAPLSGTGRDRLKAAAMRHKDVIRCGLCGVKLGLRGYGDSALNCRPNGFSTAVAE